MINSITIKIILASWFAASVITAQQININRIEIMPNKPDPYLMRNWKQVAIGYDSLVFNYNAQGQYLPLIRDNNNTVNYPGHSSFGLHTVVGTVAPQSAEAINCLPAVIGATLVGIDKSNQNGKDFVLMCEEWFNKRPEQNVYKNHPVDDTYDDWWYETMPNVFFYQLYDLYPYTGDFANQFISVADQWLTAVETMGGSTTPWKVPYINYRGWDLSDMTPYDTGVPEPEAAGALAWILYNAYIETGDERYRIGAEWCLEFLNSLTSNPSYELQLPYGAYIAARMNAELGTSCDIRKILNWCFDVGQLRNWGTIVGRWGGYDVNGLVGEVNGSNDYPFSMNTFEHIGALVPLVRYDERFARAIGKWVLNAANSARLFYTNYLPDNKQDSEEWGHQYDPNSYLAHEAMREEKYGQSPYATGDAIDGGWGATNYTLYSSSHVGILGGIIDSTNIPMILKLDLLKTDYFHDEAHPTYLMYNPYEDEQSIELEVGWGIYDIYDAVSSSFIQYSASGTTAINIPADNALILVMVPAGSDIQSNLNKTYAEGIVIDYNNGIDVTNYPPRIKSLSPESRIVLSGERVDIYCTAVDRDGDNLLYSWYINSENYNSNESIIAWETPPEIGSYIITCIVDDGKGARDTSSTTIEVVSMINNLPTITGFKAQPRKVDINGTSKLKCFAEDTDGDMLSYSWSSNFGIIEGAGDSVLWNAPSTEGDYFITCSVDDGKGGIAVDSISVRVRDFSITQQGNLVAFYPFNGNANDESGNNLNGIVSGAVLTQDRFQNSSSAYNFDGINDNIKITDHNLLNFTQAITISLWIKITEFFEREAYPISHGNWENRWKISITNKRLRWTVKSSEGIKDLDSETELVKNKLYNVVVVYSGSDYEVYLNGELNAFSTFTGTILSTNYDLTIGQVLPNNNEYNFKGVIDDVRIYDYALPHNDIIALYDISTSIQEETDDIMPTSNYLHQNYPNPFNGQTKIFFRLSKQEHVIIEVFDILGNKITRLVDGVFTVGNHQATWDGRNNKNVQISSGIYFYRMTCGNYFQIRKMLMMR